jgi:hypothetical protein
MPAFRPRIRALAVGIGAFALLAVAGGGTLAASTNPPTLYACFNANGQVAMATIPQCKLSGGGQLAYWSTAGVPGPTGATGATGAAGPTGPTGAPGASGPVSGYQVVTATGTTLLFAGDTTQGAQADCPAGKRALGGGGDGAFFRPGAYTGVNPQLMQSRPYGTVSDGWLVGYSMPDGSGFPSGWSLQWDVWVICATVAP